MLTLADCRAVRVRLDRLVTLAEVWASATEVAEAGRELCQLVGDLTPYIETRREADALLLAVTAGVATLTLAEARES